MPLYEYKCKSCDHEFEMVQKFSDRPIKKCPECNQPSVEKKISLTGFHLKGGGWHSDGYAKPSENKKIPEAKPEIKTTETKTPPKGKNDA